MIAGIKHMTRSPQALKLISLRKQHNYKQDDVSLYLNISRSGYSQYETGNYVPSNEILLKLAKLYNIDISELVNLETVPIHVEHISDNTEHYNFNKNNFSIFSLNDLCNICKECQSDFDVNSITQGDINLLSLFKQLPIEEQEDLKLFVKCKLNNK